MGTVKLSLQILVVFIFCCNTFHHLCIRLIFLPSGFKRKYSKEDSRRVKQFNVVKSIDTRFLFTTVTKIMFSATAVVVCSHHLGAAVCSSSTRLNTLAALWSTLPLCVFVYLRSGRCWRDTVKNVALCAVRLRHPGAVVSAWKGWQYSGVC